MRSSTPGPRTAALFIALLVSLSASAVEGAPPKPPGMFEASAAKQATACTRDDQCPQGTYCAHHEGRCAKVRKPVNLAYLFYLSRDRRFTEVLGLFWQHDKGREGYRVVFPLYWERWRGAKRSRMLLPLYWDFRGENRRTVVVPPIDYRRRGDARTFNIWPLAFHHRDPQRDHSSLTLLPLWHRSRTGRKSLTILPPLLSYASSDPDRQRSSLLIGGLFYLGGDGEQRSSALFPLYYHSSAAKLERSFSWFLPLNFYRRRGDSRWLGLLPLFSHAWRPRRSTTLALAPPMYLHRSPGKRRVYLPPLFWYHRDGEGGLATRTTIAGPVYHRARPGGGAFGVAPLLFSGWSERSRYLTLFPWLWHAKGPERNTWVVGPSFYHRRRDQRWAGLAPLLYARWAPRSTTLSVLPLFDYRSRRGGEASQLISPLFFYERDAQAGRRQWAALPLYYQRRDRRWSIDIGLPLFAHVRDKLARSSTTVAGPLFLRSEPNKSAQVLFPLLWRFRSGQGERERTKLLVAPFFYRSTAPGRSTTVGFPLFWRFRDPAATHTMLLPLAYLRRDRDGRGLFAIGGPGYYRRYEDGYAAGLAPLAFFGRRGSRSHQVIFPLFWRFTKPGHSLTIAGPVFHRKSPEGNTGGVAPLVYWGREGERRHRVVFPLFWRFEKPGRSTTVVGPVYHQRRERGHSTGVAPLVFVGRRRERSYQVVFPLFWRFSRPGSSLTVAGPVFHRRHERGHRSGVAPLVFWGRSGERRHQVVFPLFWRFADEDGSTVVAGSAFWSRSGERKTHGVLPLYVSGRRGDGRSFLTLPPLLFHHHRDPQRGRSFTWAGLYSGSKSKTRRTHRLWPLFHYRRQQLSEVASRTTVGLMPLFHYRRGPDSTRLLTPIGGFARGPGSLDALIGPGYYRSNEQRRAFGLLPLLFVNWSRPPRSQAPGGERAESRHRVTLLPLFDYAKRPGRRSLYTAVFGFRKSERSTSWYLGPYINHRSKRSALDVVLPLGWRYRDRRREETTIFTLPGYYGSWSPHHRRHVVFPLLWHHQRSVGEGTRGHTVAFPLYWSFHRPGRHSRVFFPLVWDFRRGDRRTTVALNVLYRRNTRRKTYDFHVLPIFRLQRKRPQDIKVSVLGGLAGYERIGRNRYMKLLFIPIELAPVKAQPKQLSRKGGKQ